MTEYPHKLVRNTQIGPPLNLLTPEAWDRDRLGRSVSVRKVTEKDLEHLWNLARESLPTIASRDVIGRVLAQAPDSVWAITRRRGSAGEQRADGFIAVLPLSAIGRAQVARNAFNGFDPDGDAITPPGGSPAALYVWAVYAPGSLIAAVPLLLSGPNYCDVDIITRAATPEGERLAKVLGLKRNALIDGIRAPHVYFLPRTRAADSNEPTYATHRPGLTDRTVSVTVVNSIDQLHRALSIRAAVFMAEQACPYEEEFDGNDFAGSHLLGFVGDEPAGCARVRFFAGFAKIERVAVRAEFRHSRLAYEIARAAVDLCRKKGYETLYCHSQKRWVRLWKRFGFLPFKNGREFAFSDFEYIELIANVPADPDAVSIDSGPYVLLRPEGHWHKTGILEASSGRATGNGAASRACQ